MKKIFSIFSVLIFLTVSEKTYSIGFDDFGSVWGEYYAEALNEFVDLGIVDESDLEEFSDSFPARVDVEGGTADIKVFPNTLFFGAWPKGFRSPKLPIIVTNDGVEPSLIRKVEITGDHEEDFKIESEDCEGETLGDADTCDIRVSFKPKDIGDRKADLVIHWFSASQGFQKVTVNLYGIGLPTSPTDICDFDDLIKGKCGGDGFDFPSPFSAEVGEVVDEEGNPVIEETSIDGSEVETKGGCNFGSVPSIPLFMIVPVLIALRRRIRV